MGPFSTTWKNNETLLDATVMVSREKKKKNQPHYHILVGTIFKKTNYKDFPGGQWLRLYASSVGGVYLVSGWGTKISYASQLSQNKKRKQTK